MPNDSPQFPLIYRVMEARRWHICKNMLTLSTDHNPKRIPLAQSYLTISLNIFSLIRFNALSLPLWHSITFDFFFKIQPNIQWLLKMQWAKASYTKHSPDEPTDARWSENTICYIVEIPPKNQVYFSLFSKDQKNEMCLSHRFSTFQYF